MVAPGGRAELHRRGAGDRARRRRALGVGVAPARLAAPAGRGRGNIVAMKILYGVVGEGMGHAMRSRVVLDALAEHHDIQVVVSGRAYDYLKARASENLSVRKIWGYTLVYEDNEVQKFRTLLENARGALSGWPENVRAYFELAEKFQPDVVISDFESWSYLFAKRHDLPVISVDNIQMIHRCAHAPEIIAGLESEYRMTKAF